ncbi:Hypothetical predicted protein, partial [Paramuricea clavata]
TVALNSRNVKVFMHMIYHSKHRTITKASHQTFSHHPIRRDTLEQERKKSLAESDPKTILIIIEYNILHTTSGSSKLHKRCPAQYSTMAFGFAYRYQTHFSYLSFYITAISLRKFKMNENEFVPSHDLIIYCGPAANVICHRINFIMTHRTTFEKNFGMSRAKVVQCNATTYCPDGNTCCRLASGQWGCCPFPSAVCCSDGVHCCPHGYTCTSGQCHKGSHITKLFKKKPAIQAKNVVCPDGSQCPAGDTCCELSSGGYGCCPLPNAVCCSDGKHCCPEGYTCDVSQGTCTQRGQITTLFLNKPALKAEQPMKNK